jgi:hypothetical protein
MLTSFTTVPAGTVTLPTTCELSSAGKTTGCFKCKVFGHAAGFEARSAGSKGLGGPGGGAGAGAGVDGAVSSGGVVATAGAGVVSISGVEAGGGAAVAAATEGSGVAAAAGADDASGAKAGVAAIFGDAGTGTAGAALEVATGGVFAGFDISADTEAMKLRTWLWRPDSRKYATAAAVKMRITFTAIMNPLFPVPGLELDAAGGAVHAGLNSVILPEGLRSEVRPGLEAAVIPRISPKVFHSDVPA